jgi:hypothetical protein
MKQLQIYQKGKKSDKILFPQKKKKKKKKKKKEEEEEDQILMKLLFFFCWINIDEALGTFQESKSHYSKF